MPSSGPRYPGTVATEVGPSGDNDWLNPSNITADDGALAEITAATFDAGDDSYRLKATSFGFSIPAGATIDGIVVEVERSNAAGAASDNEVRLYDSTGTLVGDNKAAAGDWPAGLTLATYGGATDTWNAGLDDADINSGSFGVAFIVNADGANTDIGVDYIRVTVHYTGGGGGGGLTHTEYFVETTLSGTNPTVAVPNVVWDEGDTIIVYVSGRDDSAVLSSVSDNGPGETYTAREQLLTVQGVLWAGLFTAKAAGSTAGATVTLQITEDNYLADGAAQATVIVVPNSDFDASDQAETGATDTATASVDLTTVAAVTRWFAFFQMRNRILTIDSGDSMTAIRENDQVGASGNIGSTSSYYKDETSAGAKNASGTLSSAIDWCAIAVSVTEATEAGPSGAGRGGSVTTPTSQGKKSTSKVDQTALATSSASVGRKSTVKSSLGGTVTASTAPAKKHAIGRALGGIVAAALTPGKKASSGRHTSATVSAPTTVRGPVTKGGRTLGGTVSGSNDTGRKSITRTALGGTVSASAAPGVKTGVGRTLSGVVFVPTATRPVEGATGVGLAEVVGTPTTQGTATKAGRTLAGVAFAPTSQGARSVIRQALAGLTSVPTSTGAKVAVGRVIAAVIGASTTSGISTRVGNALAGLVGIPTTVGKKTAVGRAIGGIVTSAVSTHTRTAAGRAQGGTVFAPTTTTADSRVGMGGIVTAPTTSGGKHAVGRSMGKLALLPVVSGVHAARGSALAGGVTGTAATGNKEGRGTVQGLLASTVEVAGTASKVGVNVAGLVFLPSTARLGDAVPESAVTTIRLRSGGVTLVTVRGKPTTGVTARKKPKAVVL